ncbi:hypothetical protein HLA99_13995 [Microbacterium ulmi]|uniref:Uncharacterized protein n=1 Tax=Microbacterium ulmi TaxID=179095 RepID=A0A7Y2Q127_9MICO|nr:hypothetical protein [Microbacterium ulmi]
MSEVAEPVAAPAAASRSRARLGVDLGLLALVGVLLVAALGAGAAVVYHDFYSPRAFVLRYLDLLSERHAADALGVAGVTVDSAELEAAGLPGTSSAALLRRDALAPLTDVEVVSEEPLGDTTRITVSYRAGSVPGTTTFSVERAGTIGVAPTWRFATSPLAVIDLTVRGSMSFDVNGFTVDKRQVSPDGADADPLASVPLLVFSPGIYSVSVDTQIAATPGVAVLSDSPLTQTPVIVQATATDEFVSLVQNSVDEFLTSCATQDVLQPTGCPFGYLVQDRIVSPPTWSIVQQPAVRLEPDGAGWSMPPTDATAHIEVDIRSLFDGSVRHVREDVPFIVTAQISVLPDGKVNIAVSGPDTR